MKKTLIKTLLCGFLLLFVSCDLIPIGGFFEETDFGFPKTVILPQEGGERVFVGNAFAIASINAATNYEYNEEDSTVILKCDWLKVEYKDDFCDGVLKIYAEPNTTGKSRELSVTVTQAYDYQDIKIKQGK